MFHVKPWLPLWAAAAAIAALAPACGRQPRVDPAKERAAPREEQREPLAGARARVEVGEIVVADPEGKRLWRASADSIEWNYDQQQAVLREVECEFTQEGKVALEARAPLVTAYIGQRRVVLQRGVKARAPETKTLLEADRVEWDARQEEVYATGDVKYVRGGIMLTGQKLRADLGLRKARMEGGVQLRAVQGER